MRESGSNAFLEWYGCPDAARPSGGGRSSHGLASGASPSWDMIMARIGIRTRSGVRLLIRVFELGDAYGETAEVSHEVLTIALTSASRPVLV